jgi:hypothetical protein
MLCAVGVVREEPRRFRCFGEAARGGGTLKPCRFTDDVPLGFPL